MTHECVCLLFFFKEKTAYEITRGLEFRRVLFRSRWPRPLFQALHQREPSKASSTDRKSTRLNSSHLVISYAVFCLKKKTDAGRQGAVRLTALRRNGSMGAGSLRGVLHFSGFFFNDTGPPEFPPLPLQTAFQV